jgi:glucosamine-6-phosphate deaminase
MDDYLLPEVNPASFRYLLKKQFFNHLADFTDKSKVHFLNIGNATDDFSYSFLNYYKDLVLEYGTDIQVKGQGEDGHWGYHQPGTPFGNEPSIIEVKLNNMNISQQLRDHPDLFKSINDPPRVAY